LDQLAGILDRAAPEAAAAPGPTPEPTAVIAGPVGSGKTALALKAAHQALARGRFPGGVLFADLDRLDGPELLGGFLRAMGVRADRVPPSGGERAALYARLHAALARGHAPVLVVLDNVTDPGRITGLLPGAATTLVTTPVHLGGLRSSPLVLRPLPPREAVLLLHRALTMAQPTDRRILDHPEDAARVAELCDGLPLALRTAATLLAENPSRPPAGLAADLANPSNRLDELACPEPDLRLRLDARHARLTTAQARLLHLLALTEEEQTGTRTLAALAGEPEDAVRERLTSLLHLVESVPAQDSWRMSVLVRLYVRGRAGREPRQSPEREP
jgi:hypothetical protein